jgi:hypothetical protein
MMKKPIEFLAKVCLFGAMLVTTLWLIFFVVLPPDYREPFAVVFIKQAYLSHAAGPKVIILGGSNALFGIDSGLLEQRLGRPVVNLALQFGIPLSMQMNQIEPYLKPGDLVVMSLEYGYYVFPDGSNASMARLLEVYPQAVTWLDPINLKGLPDMLKITFQEKYNRLLSNPGGYPSASIPQILDPGAHLPESLVRTFSPQGDLLAHLDLPGKPIENGPFFTYSQYNARFTEIVTTIDRRARARGALAVLTFPSSRASNCAATEQTFTELKRRLKADLTLPIVGSPESYCFPDAYFFDTSYHLLREGRQVRTEQMAADIQPYLK